VLVGAVRRLARLIKAAAFGIEEAAMIAAADPPGLDVTVVERGAPMGAVGIEQAHPSPTVTEQDEVLPQDAHRPGQVGQLSGEAHRLPEAAEQLARRRAGASLG
jgi:hypothetical protein